MQFQLLRFQSQTLQTLAAAPITSILTGKSADVTIEPGDTDLTLQLTAKCIRALLKSFFFLFGEKNCTFYSITLSETSRSFFIKANQIMSWEPMHRKQTNQSSAHDWPRTPLA